MSPRPVSSAWIFALVPAFACGAGCTGSAAGSATTSPEGGGASSSSSSPSGDAAAPGKDAGPGNGGSPGDGSTTTPPASDAGGVEPVADAGETADGGTGPSAVVTLAIGLQDPTGIAVDATNVYVATFNSIVSLPLSGGAAAILVSTTEPSSLALDANNIYWTGPDGVSSCPLAGGTATLLATTSMGATELAVDATNVYFTVWNATAGTVTAVPIAGGPATTLASNQPNPWGIGVRAGTVFWSNEGSDSLQVPGAILSVPAAGGAITTVAAGEAADAGARASDPGPIALDATSVYWTESLRHLVRKAGLAGGAPVTLATTDSLPSAIVVDATYVYWVEDDMATTVWLRRVPLGGGAVTTLFTAPEQLYDGHFLAQDATHLYWTNRLEGTVQSIAK
jgi:hypothetical protein